MRSAADGRRAARTRAGTGAACFIVARRRVLARAVTIGLRALFGYDPTARRRGASCRSRCSPCRCSSSSASACFDYWFYWAAGRPTRPEDHSGHGAHRWKDYFRVNTDHKVIGIQYIVTSFFFLFVGGLLAMLMRAELAAPGRQFVDANTFNGLFSASTRRC